MKKNKQIMFLLFLFSALLVSGSLTPAFASAPNAPTSLTAIAVSSSQIHLSWTASTVSGIQATGGTITTSGGNTINTFTSSGTFTVTSGSGTVNILVVGGGNTGNMGGTWGSNSCTSTPAGGQGGSGGTVTSASPSVSPQNYTITVGSTGGTSSALGTTSTGGSGVTGGTGGFYDGSYHNGASGTAGTSSSISGSAYKYGGSGGGGSAGCNSAGGSGGADGGGTGGTSSGGSGGTSATGSGGGGGSAGTTFGGGGGGKTGGAGATGVVIISRTTPDPIVTGYKIERSPDNSTWSTIKANTGNATTTYHDTGLSTGTLYYYRVSAINSDGTSSVSNSAHATTNGVPSTPTLSKVNTLNSTAINATWTNPTGTTWSWLNATLSGGATTHINTTKTFVILNNYTAGDKYTFSLVAGNGSGKSGSSLTKYNYTTNIPPTSLVFSSIAKNSARVSWTNPSGNFSGFKIEYSANGGTSYVTATSNTNNSTNHYDLTSLLSNVLYTVRASTNYGTGSNYSGTSSPSATNTFTTISTAPTSAKATTSSTSQINLSWTDTGNGTITGHKLEYSANGGTSYVTASANTGNSTNHYDFTGLSPNVLYTLRVSTINAGGTSSTSTTTQTTISNAPSGLLFSGTTQTSTILSWTAPNGNATISGYEIDKSIDNGVTYSTVSANTGNSTVSYTVTGLTASTTYYFKVEAINAGGTSASLTPASVTTLAAPTPSPTPTASGGGGSGVGGPVTPLQLTPIVPAISQGITFTASNDVIMPNQIKNETVTITWPSGETLNVNTIQFGATSLQTKLANTPPYGLTGNVYGTSTATITYILQVPQQCDGTVTTNCINITIPTMNLPISFDVTLNGTETSQTVTPQFNIQQETQLPLPLIVIGVSFVAAAYLILRYKLRTSKLDPKKHFKTEKPKQQRLDKPKKKR